MNMDSQYIHAFPRDSFDAEAFRPTVRSFPIQPIDVSFPSDAVMGDAGCLAPPMFVNPALIQNMHSGAFPADGAPAHLQHYGSPTIHPASLHYGNVMPGQMMGDQPYMGEQMSRPEAGHGHTHTASWPSDLRVTGFSRRSEASTFGPSRHSIAAIGGGVNEPYFCRTSSSTLRQRTAQACEKCRDRKTKCSGERPVCKRCADRGMVCKWAPETRVRGHSRSKASIQIPVSDLPSEPSDVIPEAVSESSSEEQPSDAKEEATATPVKDAASKTRPKRGSVSRVKKSFAAQRNSWPMVNTPQNSPHLASGMLPQTSIKLPVSSLDSTDDDTWGSVWTRREPQVDAAPIPGRAFDIETLINNSLDYSSGSSRDSSPPASISTSDSNLSTLSSSFDSLDGLSGMLQSQLPSTEDSSFTAEMYDLLNLPASSASSSASSSSGSSPESIIVDSDSYINFAEAVKANGGEIDSEITPVPQVALGHDDNYMSQFLSSDYYGM